MKLAPFRTASFVAILAIPAASVWSADSAETATGTIVVNTTAYPENRGDALFQLASSQHDYESDDAAFRSFSVAVADNAATAVFADVPYGEYAVKVFHDANRNRKLDMGWTGPKEAYGFSNNARGRFGPPSYDDAKFVLAQEQLIVAIEVK